MVFLLLILTFSIIFCILLLFQTISKFGGEFGHMNVHRYPLEKRLVIWGVGVQV